MKCVTPFLIAFSMGCIALEACQEETSAYRMIDTQKDDTARYSFVIDSFKLNIDSAQLNSYSVFCSYANRQTDYFIGYNAKNNSLNIFDLSAGKAVKNVFFNADGPKAIGRVRSIYVQNLDSIFLSTENNIFLVDTLYTIKKKIAINNIQQEVTGINFARFNFSCKDPAFRIYYHPARQSLFLYAYPIIAPYNKSSYYRENFLYELPVSRLTANKVPVFYSALYTEKGKFYSSLNMPNVTFNGDSVIYTFPIDPNIYTYNIKTDTHNVYGGQSINTKNSAYSLDPSDVGNSEKEIRWIIESTIFHQVIFDPYRSLYYRIHDGGIPYEINSTFYNSFGDKPYFLSVYNKNFKLIDEIRLQKNRYYPNLYFVTRDGLWLSNSGYRNVAQKENELSFDRFIFSPVKQKSI